MRNRWRRSEPSAMSSESSLCASFECWSTAWMCGLRVSPKRLNVRRGDGRRPSRVRTRADRFDVGRLGRSRVHRKSQKPPRALERQGVDPLPRDSARPASWALVPRPAASAMRGHGSVERFPEVHAMDLSTNRRGQWLDFDCAHSNELLGERVPAEYSQ